MNGTQAASSLAAHERLTTEQIRKLMNSDGPCITMLLAANERRDFRSELNAALHRVQRQLELTPGAGTAALLSPIRALLQDITEERKKPAVTAILRSPSEFHILRADPGLSVKQIGPNETVAVAGRFAIRTLLSIAAAQKQFYILALSQKRTRIVECTDHSSEEVPYPTKHARSFEEWAHIRQPDHLLDNRSTGGPSTGSMPGVVFGTSTDRESKDQFLLHFFSEIDKAVHEVLRGRTDPLVAAGVEHEIALYRRENTYPHLVEGGVQAAPDGLEGKELHERALKVLEENPKDPVRELLANFDKRVGTGHASTRIEEIAEAAYNGRVEHFFFQDSANYPGVFDEAYRRAEVAKGQMETPLELVDFTAAQTIFHSGEASIQPASHMPNGAPVCAIFRYPKP